MRLNDIDEYIDRVDANRAGAFQEKSQAQLDLENSLRRKREELIQQAEEQRKKDKEEEMKNKKPFKINVDVVDVDNTGYSFSSDIKYTHEYPDGLELLKLVREELKTHELPFKVDLNNLQIERDCKRIDRFEIQFTLEEVESDPKLVEFFNSNFSVSIDIDEKIIGKFCKTTIKKITDRTSYTRVELSYNFDGESLIDAWKKNGYPKRWEKQKGSIHDPQDERDMKNKFPEIERTSFIEKIKNWSQWLKDNWS